MRWQRERLLPTVRAVLQSLQADPLTGVERVKLAVTALPWPELEAYLVAMAERSELTMDVMMSALCAFTFKEIRHRSEIADIAVLESALSTHADERLRRLALAALVALTSTPSGWTDALLARLQAYRADPSPLVAAAAQFTFPPGELAGAE